MKPITAKTKICMVIGDPIAHSLSPAMHNAGYHALGIEDQFVYVASNVNIADMRQFVDGVRAMGIRGISCTIPHKLAIMKYLDRIDETAQAIGAVNTVVNTAGILTGHNTDWEGAVIALEKRTKLKNKTVAVIGAGGAARAIVYGLTKRGAKVTICNRSHDAAQKLADEFGCIVGDITDSSRVSGMDIIVNATPVGMHPHENISPIPKSAIRPHHIVFDIVYVPHETQLLKDAKAKKATVIHGIEMLLYQGTAQFELYTGVKAPVDAMRTTLVRHI